MRIQYILSAEEVRAAKSRLYELKNCALLSRDAGEREDNRDFYLRAKGFEDALIILGIMKDGQK